MTIRSAVASVLILLIAAPPLMAKQRREPPEVWREYADKLNAGAFVKVRMTDGTRITGHVIQVTQDALRVRPKTRILIPVRDLAFTDIESIERQKEGMSPGAKILGGIGVGAAAILGVLLILFATLSD